MYTGLYIYVRQHKREVQVRPRRGRRPSSRPQSTELTNRGAHSLPSLPLSTLGAAAGHVRGLVPYCGPIYTLSSGFVVRSGPTGTGRDFQNGNRRGAGGDRRVAGESGATCSWGGIRPGTGAAHGARSLQSVLSVSLTEPLTSGVSCQCVRVRVRCVQKATSLFI